MFESHCDFHVFVLFSILSKNDQAGPTYVAGVD